MPELQESVLEQTTKNRKEEKSGVKRIYGWRLLKRIAEEMLPQMPASGHPYAYRLSLPVITVILQAAFATKTPETLISRNWVNTHVLSKHPATPYLRSEADNALDYNLHLCRVVELAELLYNLQTVPGIEAIYRRIVNDAEGLEATILELEGLRLLWLAKLPFQIIQSGSGKRYECEITLPNSTTAYCEMKCKVKETFSKSNVKTSLDTARGQLPEGHCGIVIMKIPSPWIESVETWATLETVVGAVLRNSTRISEIILYERAFILEETVSVYPLAFKEILNQRSPYAAALEGGLIQDRIQRAGNTGWVPFGILTHDVLKQLLAVQLGGPLDQNS